jgi:hypothetical protein
MRRAASQRDDINVSEAAGIHIPGFKSDGLADMVSFPRQIVGEVLLCMLATHQWPVRDELDTDELGVDLERCPRTEIFSDGMQVVEYVRVKAALSLRPARLISPPTGAREDRHSSPMTDWYRKV